jgi:hypothetical protein
MTNQEIAAFLSQVRGAEKHKLLGAGKHYLKLMNTSIVKGYLTCEKDKLALTTIGSEFLKLVNKDSDTKKKIHG